MSDPCYRALIKNCHQHNIYINYYTLHILYIVYYYYNYLPSNAMEHKHIYRRFEFNISADFCRIFDLFYIAWMALRCDWNGLSVQEIAMKQWIDRFLNGKMGLGSGY
jgi:hypothetical protein